MTDTGIPPLQETRFALAGQTGFYRGKVRDVYEVSGRYLALVATDRISAFDHILPRPIPGKGAILNTIAADYLRLTKDIVPNWLLDVPDARVSVGYKCEPFPVEMVIRGCLCGHALRQYHAGRRSLSGVPMPEGMRAYEPFPEPIITPATKAHAGHDEDISREDIIARGLVSEKEYARLEEYTRALFAEGQRYAASRGLVLADTKYEFGSREAEIYLIDEVHTPDSSRYFHAEGYEDHIKNGTTPKQLSKEFVREWLMANGFQGREGDRMPEMTDEVVSSIVHRYEELYRLLTGKPFDGTQIEPDPARLQEKIERSLERVSR